MTSRNHPFTYCVDCDTYSQETVMAFLGTPLAIMIQAEYLLALFVIACVATFALDMVGIKVYRAFQR
jgi:hypothetical protein